MWIYPFMPLEAVWRSCSSAEGHSSSSSHMRLGGSPQLRRTSRKPVGLDMPSYKCLCKVLCSDFPRSVEAALSYLQKAEVWPNGSFSPSRPTWGGLRAQTLLLAKQGCARLVSDNSSVHGSMPERQGRGTCARAHTLSPEWHCTASYKDCCNTLLSCVDAGPGKQSFNSCCSYISLLAFY